MREFWREVRERKVVRVAIAYLVVAWVMLQLADVVLPAMQLPEWSITLTLVLLAIGFPVALVLAWVFDLTPSVIERVPSTAILRGGTETGAAPGPGLPASPARAPDRSIAVLPFTDMSAERDQEHFCDGLTEELLNALTCIPNLRVASRTSSFAFKARDADIATVAERLKVAYILEGSVRKDGSKVRITAQLIEVASDSHLWSQTYDRELCDIFAIQGDIAQHVLDALKVKLGDRQLPSSTTEDAKAYEYYLRGRGYFLTKTDTDMRRAIGMFRKAVEADPCFVRAWAALAEASSMTALFHVGGKDAVKIAQAASRKAMEMAPNRSDSHMARGMAALAAGKFKEAELYFHKALSIDADQIHAWHYLARAAHHQGDRSREIEYFTKATELDAEDWESPLLSAGCYTAIGDTENAKRVASIGIERAQKHLEDYPDNPRAYYLSISGFLVLGDLDRAHDYAEKALALAPDDGPTRYNLACFYASVGDVEKALDLLEGSISSRSWMENDPELDNVRDHPRFKAVIESLPSWTD